MWTIITKTQHLRKLLFILPLVPTSLSLVSRGCVSSAASHSSPSLAFPPFQRLETSRPRRSVRSMPLLPRPHIRTALSFTTSPLSSSFAVAGLAPSRWPRRRPSPRRSISTTATTARSLFHSSSSSSSSDVRMYGLGQFHEEGEWMGKGDGNGASVDARCHDIDSDNNRDNDHDDDNDDDPWKWEKMYYGSASGNGNDIKLDFNSFGDDGDDNINNNIMNGNSKYNKNRYNNNSNNSNNSNNNKRKTSSPIRVITFDLDNTLWKTTPTISHANDVLADYLQTTLGFDRRTRVEHEMGRLFRRCPDKYVGLVSPSAVGEEERRGRERTNDNNNNSDAKEIENENDLRINNEKDNEIGKAPDDDNGVHISSGQRHTAGKIKPVYLTLLRKDAIRSLILQSSSSKLSAEEMESLVEQAFRIWADARIHSIQTNFAVNAVECLRRLQRDVASLPSSSSSSSSLPSSSSSSSSLSYFKKAIYIGAITDGNSDPTSVPQLRDLFDFVVRAEDVGASKPDRRVYRAAVGELMVRLTRDGRCVNRFFLEMDENNEEETMEKEEKEEDNDGDGIGIGIFPKMTTTTTTTTTNSWKDIDEDTLEAFSEAVGPWWVHVGDDFFKDVVAAKEFGMRSVWVRELIGGAGATAETIEDVNDKPKKERTVQDLVEELSKKENGVIEMAIGESNFLANALHEEFSDAILEKFEDLGDLLIGWHREGCVGEIIMDRRAEEGETNLSVEEDDVAASGKPVAEPSPSPKQPSLSGEETRTKVDSKFCVFCGEKIPVVAKFCSGCGERQP
ncbi:hypothetical protein ACHAXS_007591 [Conticribra weissflogii]